MPTPAYNLIKAESEKVGWPKHYETDLDMDARSIQMLYENDDLVRFGWGIRENGTHLVFSAKDVSQINTVWIHELVRWYYFDGYDLREMSVLELCDILGD